MNKIIDILITRGKELLDSEYKAVEFTKDENADKYLNDFENHPHAFVLACIMDRQIKAERAWFIPYRISNHIKSNEFSTLLTLGVSDLKSIFRELSLHRFNDMMAEYYHCAIQKIHETYDDEASNIWLNNPGSATIVKRFLQFKGVGIKIATMATNILVREFKIPLKDHICIEISPDVQVKRVFKRLGLMPLEAGDDELIYTARELNPSYPGIFDLSCWEIGRNWCTPKKPKCQDCYLNEYCPKHNC